MKIYKEKFLLLLVSLIIAIFAFPLLIQRPVGWVLFLSVFSAILIVIVYEVRHATLVFYRIRCQSDSQIPNIVIPPVRSEFSRLTRG